MTPTRFKPIDELQTRFEPLRIAFVCIALLLGVMATAHAAVPGTGELSIQDADAPRVVPSLSTEVKITISGLIAEVAVHQRFRNDGAAWMEGQYLLPLPTGAAVHDLKLHIGERVIVGEIREKLAAQAEYAIAMQQGKKASLVEQASGNLFRTSVANVAAGEMIDVEIGYWQRVDYRDGQFSLSFPLTYTERYPLSTQGEASAKTQEVSNDSANMPIVGASPEVSVVAELEPGLPLQQVDSPTHAIVIEQTGQHYHIRLQQESIASDRDFVLTWKPKPQAAPSAALFTERVGNENYALVMLMPQTTLSQSMPRELILVIDTSGSMEGGSIQQARAALDAALLHLTPHDRFNVIEFNSDMHTLFESAVPATAQDVQLAREWVAHLRASGGTEMFPALDQALSGTAPDGFVRQVVFATDGAVENDVGLLQLIERKLGNSRLFPVGIGSAPNGRFLDKVAQMGRGTGVVIRDLNEVGEKMQQLLAKLDRPALRDLNLRWPQGADSYPRQLPDLYLGEPLLMVAQLPKLGGQLEALGWLADSDWSQSLALDHGAAASGIARLWARNKIEDLEDASQRGANEDDVRRQIIAIGVTHHLVSRYTSLVAVDKTPVRPVNEGMQSAQIPNAIPAGQQLAYAKTATSATLQWWLGISALLIAFGLRHRWQRPDVVAIHPSIQ